MQPRLFQKSQRALTLVCVACTCLAHGTVSAKSPVNNQRFFLRNVDSLGLDHWRKWRDQHSEIWFLHDWRVSETSHSRRVIWKHLTVKIFKTLGAQQRKAGEQAVLKIFEKRNLLFCSDRPGEYDSEWVNCEPVCIFTLDSDKVAIISRAGTGFSVRVFHYHKGRVTEVLVKGSKRFPEFAYEKNSVKLSKNSDLRVITTELQGREGFSNVYCWNRASHRYDHERILFEKRLD